MWAFSKANVDVLPVALFLLVSAIAISVGYSQSKMPNTSKAFIKALGESGLKCVTSDVVQHLIIHQTKL